MAEPKNPYQYVQRGDKSPPQYDRVVRTLNDRELEAELAGPQAEQNPEYREALLAERERR